jgi:hypothetical protein
MLALGFVVLTVLLFGLIPSRLPRWRLAVAAGVILVLGPACGSDDPTDPGPTPVNGVFDVIGTAGPLTRSMQVTITINP